MPKPTNLRVRYLWKPRTKRTSKSKTRIRYAFFRAAPFFVPSKYDYYWLGERR